MTVERARDVLNAVSAGRGSGHAYTSEEAECLLRFATALASAGTRTAYAPLPATRPAVGAANGSLRIIRLDQAA